jgi:hypothetical protein
VVVVFALISGVAGALVVPATAAHAVGASTEAPATLGVIDSVRATPGGFQLDGWAAETGVTDPILVAVYVDDRAVGTFAADAIRGDWYVWPFTEVGPNHGFHIPVAAAPGPHTACVWGLGVSIAAGNALLGCVPVTVLGNDPIGSVDVATAPGPGTLRVAGWVLDPDLEIDSPGSTLAVAVYLDGQGLAQYTAGWPRPDVGAAHPGYGDDHGFNVFVAAAPGTHSVCVYGINGGPGANALIGCRTVVVGGNPIGAVDVVIADGTGFAVYGWAIDPDTAASIPAAVYVNGRGVGWVPASTYRPDVGAAFPAYGSGHGYIAHFDPLPGEDQVCTYAINQGSGTTNTLLGCRDFRPVPIASAAS